MSDPKKLVLVVVNKYWECDAVFGALLGEAAPPLLRQRWPSLQAWPRQRNNPTSAPSPADPSPRPRAVYALDRTTVEVWCISDLLEHFPDRSQYQSSSERKAERLPLVLGGRTPDLVVGVGTATTGGGPDNLNGAVCVGASVFAHNGDPGNADSRWQWTFDTLVPSAFPQRLFATAVSSIAAPIVPRLLSTPRAPGVLRGLLADFDLVALGDVNVTQYAKYAAADLETLSAYNASGTGRPVGSLETTHAVIRASLGDQFIYVSGIVNRFGRLDEDVGGPGFNSAQNFAGAYNAGVAVGWLMATVDKVL